MVLNRNLRMDIDHVFDCDYFVKNFGKVCVLIPLKYVARFADTRYTPL
tara:strand:- start:39158 stop:39301 length:144 start_codon:yes stop_codon:yes gene_type:complete